MSKLVKSPVKFLPAGTYRNLYQAPPVKIKDIKTDWFGPQQPVAPIAPPGTEPRGWQYYPGQNMIYTPRATEELTFDDLRDFAKYPVVRYIIETRKDQIARQAWSIRVKPQPGETNRQRLARELKDTTIQKLTNFLNHPNPDCSWRDFLKMWMEDVLVIDAPAILLRRNRAGDVAEMRAIDGSKIARYIDENGWTPQGNQPAYAQLWYGMPMVDLTSDQLVYRPSNPRADKLYGLSRVEMAYRHIELGMKRLEMQLQFYENGSIPDGLMVVPPTATPEQIERQQAWMNSNLAGNLARRVQLRLIQGFNVDGKPEQIMFPKEKMLTDETDDFIIRSLCFAFQVSPQRWMKMVNRASAEASQEAAEEEGLAPTKDYVRDVVNFIIQVKLGFDQHEFTWADHRDPDILKQAQADKIYVDSGINTVNEIRESKGDDPSPNPAADQLLIITPQGSVELGQQIQRGPVGPDGKPAAPSKPAKTGGTQKPSQPGGTKKVAGVSESPHNHEHSSTQVNLPKEQASEIIELGRQLIADEHLRGKGRETNSHVTIKFGVHPDEDKFRKILSELKPFDIWLDKTIAFTPSEFSDGASPIVIRVVSPDMRLLHLRLEQEMGSKEDNFPYTPHVTLAYVDSELADQYDGLTDFDGMKFTADSACLTYPDGTQTEIPFGPAALHKAAAPLIPAHAMTINPHTFTPATSRARQTLEEKIMAHFHKCNMAITARMGKADSREQIVLLLDDPEFWDPIWDTLPDEILEAMEDAAIAGMHKGVLEAGLNLDGDTIQRLTDSAKQYAKDRSAEMVGKKYVKALTTDPDAEQVISEVTRKKIKKIIEQAFEDEKTLPQITQEISESTALGRDRAARIARTEVSRAQVEGNLDVWRKMNLVRKVAWQTSNLPNVCPNCEANEAAGPIDFGDPFPSGHTAPTAHPNCRCILVAVEFA